jgi:hypothetical protein
MIVVELKQQEGRGEQVQVKEMLATSSQQPDQEKLYQWINWSHPFQDL